MFCTSTLTADSHVEKLPYNWRQLLIIRLFSNVNIGDTSPAVVYKIAPPTVPDISELEILCWASRSEVRRKMLISYNQKKSQTFRKHSLNPIDEMGKVTTSAKNPCLAGAPLAINRTLKIGPFVRNKFLSLPPSASIPPMYFAVML